MCSLFLNLSLVLLKKKRWKSKDSNIILLQNRVTFQEMYYCQARWIVMYLLAKNVETSSKLENCVLHRLKFSAQTHTQTHGRIHCFALYAKNSCFCLIFITWFMVYLIFSSSFFGQTSRLDRASVMKRQLLVLSQSCYAVVSLSLYLSSSSPVWLSFPLSANSCVFFNRIIAFDKLNSTAQIAISLKLNVK